MATIYQLPAEAVNMLIKRIQDEQAAYYFYISAAAWCRLNGYDNSARYFDVETRGEEWHYKKIMKFLTDWNSVVEFKAIAEPIKTFNGLQDILKQAYEMEYVLYKTYESCAIEIFSICQNTYQMIQDFIRIQHDSVVESSNIIKKMEDYLKIDTTLIMFDKEIFEQYQYLY